MNERMDDATKDAISGLFSWMNKYARSITRTIEDAEDLASDSYLLAVQNEYRPGRGASLRGWLASIMDNRLITKVRQDKTRDGGPRYLPLAVRSAYTSGPQAVDPWEPIDTKIVADAILEPFTDRDLTILSMSTRASSAELGIHRETTCRKKKRLSGKLKSRTSRILES